MTDQPSVELLGAALVQSRPLGLQVEPLRWRIVPQERPQSGLEPARGVLERQIQDIATYNRNCAERPTARGDGDPETECHPGLAELRCAGHEGEPFGEQPIHRVAWISEILIEELSCGPASPPCRYLSVRFDFPDRSELIFDAVDDLRLGVQADHHPSRWSSSR